MSKWHVQDAERGVSFIVEAALAAGAIRQAEAVTGEDLSKASVGEIVGGAQICDPTAIELPAAIAAEADEPEEQCRAPAPAGEDVDAAPAPDHLEPSGAMVGPPLTLAEDEAPEDEEDEGDEDEEEEDEEELAPLETPIELIGLKDTVQNTLLDQDIDTVEKVEALGRQGLIALDKIGGVRADDILDAIANYRELTDGAY